MIYKGTALKNTSELSQREIAWLSNHANYGERRGLPFKPYAQTSLERHIGLYQKFLAASNDLLPTDSELVRSTLWHWDLHAPNIFVDSSRISGVIDWQDCWAGPLVLQTRRPPLVEFKGDLMLELPPECQSLEEGLEKERIRSSVEKSILLFSYESKVQRENPVLGRSSQLPQVETIRNAILFAANTWDGGIMPFRECLIRILR